MLDKNNRRGLYYSSKWERGINYLFLSYLLAIVCRLC